ncbi:MAG: hypothetical protein CM15mP74_23670 [Halieaceae bacterium]|nr:MAG: hypothetical protein CM15mP74_23670 [Halieaceae bacterium]
MVTNAILDFEVDQILAVKDSVRTKYIVLEAVIPLVVEAQASQKRKLPTVWFADRFQRVSGVVCSIWRIRPGRSSQG